MSILHTGAKDTLRSLTVEMLIQMNLPPIRKSSEDYQIQPSGHLDGAEGAKDRERCALPKEHLIKSTH